MVYAERLIYNHDTITLYMARKQVSVTIHEDHDEWIAEQVKRGRFASRSHAISYALGFVIACDAFEEE